jgi:hypothetical protein
LIIERAVVLAGWTGRDNRGTASDLNLPGFGADVCQVDVQPPPHGEDTLYQDVRWRSIARYQYGLFASPLLILGLVGSISTGVLSNVLVALALLGTLILICEWRLRKMGFILKPDCIVLVRALNHTRIPWSDVDSFELVMPSGSIDWRNRRVGIKRHRGRIPRATFKIPTVWMSAGPRARWVPPIGPSGLRWSGGDITDVLGFLNGQLAARRNAATPVASFPNAFAQAS